MKKYIFTESQVKKIIDSQISEQKYSVPVTPEDKVRFNDASEKFLDMKKIQGRDLTEKIKRYQQSIGCEVTGHILDSIDCIKQKNQKDFILLRDAIRSNRTIFAKGALWLGQLFGYKEDPESF